MEKRTIPFQEGKLEYHITGLGRAIVFIHGFGEDNRIWHEAPEQLSGNFCLLFPNLPGSGGSTPAAKPSMEIFATGIKEMLDAEGITSAQIVGHSMGGYTAMAMAELYPQYMESLVMFHSSAMADTEEKVEARKKSIDFIQNNGAEAFLKNTLPGLFKDQEESRGHINKLLEEGRQFTEDVLIGYYEAMINRPDRLEVLKAFPREVMFILGEYDKAVPLEAGLKQVHLPQRSSFHLLKNTAHMGMMEEPARCWQILRRFLSEASVKLNP